MVRRMARCQHHHLGTTSATLNADDNIGVIYFTKV